MTVFQLTANDRFDKYQTDLGIFTTLEKAQEEVIKYLNATNSSDYALPYDISNYVFYVAEWELDTKTIVSYYYQNYKMKYLELAYTTHPIEGTKCRFIRKSANISIRDLAKLFENAIHTHIDKADNCPTFIAIGSNGLLLLSQMENFIGNVIGRKINGPEILGTLYNIPVVLDCTIPYSDFFEITYYIGHSATYRGLSLNYENN